MNLLNALDMHNTAWMSQFCHHRKEYFLNFKIKYKSDDDYFRICYALSLLQRENMKTFSSKRRWKSILNWNLTKANMDYWLNSRNVSEISISLGEHWIEHINWFVMSSDRMINYRSCCERIAGKLHISLLLKALIHPQTTSL